MERISGNGFTWAFLGLGGNLGDRESMLRHAIQELKANGFNVVSRSSIYETEPWGLVEQPRFLNMVVGGWWAGGADALLKTALTVEIQLGRERKLRFGPRSIDIDILAFGDEVILTDDLEVPHPRLRTRAFVLVPWAEIAGNYLLPGSDLTIQDCMEQLPEEDLKGMTIWEEGREIL